MKKFISILLAMLMLMSLFTACGQPKEAEKEAAEPQEIKEEPAEETVEKTVREFTDSVGRTLSVPANITKIAVSGPLTQIYILPLAGDMLVGVSRRFSEDAQKYLPEEIYQKTEIGQLYGGKGELDLEALLSVAPDVVIDVGEAKKTIKEDLDSLTEQTGIPFLHIDATVMTAPEAYRTLGQLLGREEKGNELADYCQSILDNVEEMMQKVDADGNRKSLLYLLGDSGCNVLAEGSFHAETVNTMGRNLAVLEDVVSKGSGNEVDLEQILKWNPDVILFSSDSIYDEVKDMEAWQALDAISSGNYYEAPSAPYGWLSSPPSVQRYLGLLWLGELLYPEYVNYDLESAVKEYYELFYGCELTDEMYSELVVNALPRE